MKRILAIALLLTTALAAQGGQTYVGRLAPVPITADQQVTIAGSGSVTAVLEGRKLTVTGKFAGLRSPATVARMHLAPFASRGPSFAELQVTSATAGTIGGSVDLTPEQVQALQKRSIYIQLHSQKAPDGNLWGWLLPPEVKR